MKPTNEDILAAVAQLDPANDEHWTTDGQPRLDAVEVLLGSDVNRKSVTNAAPEFNRGHSQNLVDEAEDENTAGPVDDEAGTDPVNDDEAGTDPVNDDEAGTDPVNDGDGDGDGDGDSAPELDLGIPSASATDTAETSDDDDSDPLASGAAEQRARMDDEIQDAETAVVELRADIAEARIELENLENNLAKLIDAKKKAFPPQTQAQAIKEFQANELRRRAQRAGDSTTVASLDEAMKARGKQRPRQTPQG